MELTITALYAGLLTLVFLALSVIVVRARFGAKTSLGDGDDKSLMKAMRVHANFAEYVPLALILILCAELQGAPALALHAMGASVLVGRICHAIGMGWTPQNFLLRQIGIILTWAMLGLSALALIGHALL